MDLVFELISYDYIHEFKKKELKSSKIENVYDFLKSEKSPDDCVSVCICIDGRPKHYLSHLGGLTRKDAIILFDHWMKELDKSKEEK